MRHILYGRLAVLGGIADVLRMRPDDLGKFRLQRANRIPRIVQRERGLREIRDVFGVGNLKRLDLGGVRNNLRYVRGFAQCAFNFVVVAVSYENERVALLGEFDGLDMDLGDERAGGVDDLEMPVSRLLPDRRRDTVGGENDPRAFRNL